MSRPTPNIPNPMIGVFPTKTQASSNKQALTMLGA
jgi:hypothetical protein